MISAKVVHLKKIEIYSHEVSRTNTNKHDTCNKNKYQSQHIFTHLHTSSQIFKHLHTSSHIFTNPQTSSHIFTHLHTSPHIFTHLHTSSHIFTHLHALEMAASPFGMSANLRPSLGESSPGNLKYSGVMYPIAANMEILKRQ